jgi:hypothetical protein
MPVESFDPGRPGKVRLLRDMEKMWLEAAKCPWCENGAETYMLVGVKYERCNDVCTTEWGCDCGKQWRVTYEATEVEEVV